MDDVARARAWIAGAHAARAADVAVLRAEQTRMAAEAEAWRSQGRRQTAFAVDCRARGVETCADIVAGHPIPAPPAPPQRPEAPPDGGTGPQGEGAPAGGLSVAAAGAALDLTDEVGALAHCPDGHYWRPGAGIEQVVDIGDPGLPLLRREVVSLCPRCGFDWRLSSEDA